MCNVTQLSESKHSYYLNSSPETIYLLLGQQSWNLCWCRLQPIRFDLTCVATRVNVAVAWIKPHDFPPVDSISE